LITSGADDAGMIFRFLPRRRPLLIAPMAPRRRMRRRFRRRML
jgi:hypothetical protein